MGGIILTRELAFASGQDAGNRSMRDANRKRWNEQDADKATETTNRLLLYVPFDKGGLEGLAPSPAQRADLLITDQTWERVQQFHRGIGRNGGPALDREAA